MGRFMDVGWVDLKWTPRKAPNGIPKLNWESAHPIGISYADVFRYLPDGSVCWMLLGGSVGNSYRMGSFLS